MRTASLGLVLLALASCSALDGLGVAPLEGRWMGDHVVFRVDAGQLTNIWTLGVVCTGEQGGLPCTARHNAVLTGALDIFDGSFSGELGPVFLEGSFTSESTAAGSLHFVDPDGCCEATLAWSAEYVPPMLPDVGPDAAQDAARDAGGEEPDLPTPDLGQADLSEPDIPTVVPDADGGPDTSDVNEPSVTELQQRAMTALEDLRATVGTTPIAGVGTLHDAAQAHAACFANNCETYIDMGLSPHAESSDMPGFTGEQFWQRAAAAGYTMNGGWEIMAFEANPELAIDLWMETLYHRIPLVHPNAREVGYGGTTTQNERCSMWGYRGADVMDFGAGAATADDGPIMVPWEGQEDVPVRWLGNELPQPPPPPDGGYPSGPVVTITFPDAGGAITGGDHLLVGPDGEVEHVYLSPENDDYLSDTLSLYAHDPLLPGVTYTVTLGGTRGGVPFSYTWSFTTAF